MGFDLRDWGIWWVTNGGKDPLTWNRGGNVNTSRQTETRRLSGIDGNGTRAKQQVRHFHFDLRS